jgi:predicted nucleic acid-binding protein
MVNLAKRLLISTISAPRIIEFLARDGLIAAAKPYLDQMIRHGFGIPHELYVAILQRLGE